MKQFERSNMRLPLLGTSAGGLTLYCLVEDSVPIKLGYA